ncbi:MAG: DUF721 domain-containing protein [Zoogloeaceae bacterium]|nr:DUF721 domain-containing protein [Zoogloeaceae bacterium]
MPHSLDDFLLGSQAAGNVMAHARLLQKLAHIYQQVAPDYLGRTSRVANLKSGTVIIHADNGAVAVKLRQMAPSLASEFAKRGFECNGVQVKVQAIEIAGHSPAPMGHQLPMAASKALLALAEELPASPLREAIQTLVARAAKAE